MSKSNKLMIEKGIALTARNSFLSMHPEIMELEVGDSFLLPEGMIWNRFAGTYTNLKKKHGWAMSHRKQADGRVRVWRTA